MRIPNQREYGTSVTLRPYLSTVPRRGNSFTVVSNITIIEKKENNTDFILLLVPWKRNLNHL